MLNLKYKRWSFSSAPSLELFAPTESRVTAAQCNNRTLAMDKHLRKTIFIRHILYATEHLCLCLFAKACFSPVNCRCYVTLTRSLHLVMSGAQLVPPSRAKTGAPRTWAELWASWSMYLTAQSRWTTRWRELRLSQAAGMDWPLCAIKRLFAYVFLCFYPQQLTVHWRNTNKYKGI